MNQMPDFNDGQTQQRDAGKQFQRIRMSWLSTMKSTDKADKLKLNDLRGLTIMLCFICVANKSLIVYG